MRLEIYCTWLGIISADVPRVSTMSTVPDKISFESLVMLLVDKLALLTPEELENLAQEWRLAQQIRDYLDIEAPGLREPRNYWLESI